MIIINSKLIEQNRIFKFGLIFARFILHIIQIYFATIMPITDHFLIKRKG